MLRGGRSYVSSPPAFSNDAKRLLVCAGNSVSIFSTATALQVGSLEGHTGLVTAIVVVPPTSPGSKILCFCWTASLDGTIRYWDFSVPELLKTINIKSPIHSMVIPCLLSQRSEGSEQPSKVFAYLSVENTKAPSDQSKAFRGQIKKCNLTDSRLVGKLNLTETRQPEFITSDSSGRFLGIRSKRKLYIWKVPENDRERTVTKKITLYHTKTITVFAFHPTQRIVAAGDNTGRILVWRGFGKGSFAVGEGATDPISVNNGEDTPGVRGDHDADACTTWHWHPSEIKVLSFSSDGAYLYSGGKEGVLVVWQLDTGKKKYLPRIGSPLVYFTESLDPTLSSVSCADNQIHLLKMPSMEVLKSISGIKLACSLPEMYDGLSSGVAFDCNAGLVALRTENYCVQLYSLFDDRGVSEVQVCERSHQPNDEVTIVVMHVVLSKDGSLMGTSEVKFAEEGLGGLVCLKFWESGSQNKDFSLSTIVYEPHGDAGISAIAFHPIHRMAISTSYGGDFKVWVSQSGNGLMLSNRGWTCHAVGSYKRKPMTTATFSPDGSVLAVAAETVITLWDPEKNSIVAVIGESLSPIVSLSFVGRTDYLVSSSRGSKPQLSVWSMSKLTESWSYRLHVEALASSKDMSAFAVLAHLPKSLKCNNSNETGLGERDGVILYFNGSDPVPKSIWLVKKAMGGTLAFIQANNSFMEEQAVDEKPPEVLVAYMNGDREYVLFDPLGRESKERSAIQQEGIVDIEAGNYGYAAIYGELPEFSLKRNQASYIPAAPSEKPWATMFTGPSHNLPPLTKLCSAFLESLLEKRTTSTV